MIRGKLAKKLFNSNEKSRDSEEMFPKGNNDLKDEVFLDDNFDDFEDSIFSEEDIRQVQ